MSNIIALIVLGIFIYSIFCALISAYGPTKSKALASFFWMFFCGIPFGIIISLLICIKDKENPTKEES